MGTPRAVTLQCNEIKESDYVILKRGKCSKAFKVSKTKPIYFTKQLLSLGPIIGKPYSSFFELNNKKLCFVDKPSDCNEGLQTPGDCAVDNRFLIDDGKSQKLTREEIEKLKSTGTEGSTIVKEIVENSATFKEKTLFSQEKYVKRKRSKYANYIQVLRPNMRLLAEMYYEQGPLKICNLRIDTLAQMLNVANICGGNYMVVDDCLGLLVASVLERTGSQGNVVQVYLGEGPMSSARQAVELLNIGIDHVEKHLCGITFAKAVNILEPSKTDDETNNINLNQDNDTEDVCAQKRLKLELPNEDAKAENRCELKSEDILKDIDVKLSQDNVTAAKRDYSNDARTIKRLVRDQETAKATEILKSRNLDSLLVACKHHSTSIVMPLIEFLSPSRPFVIFSMYQAPLVHCYQKLKESGSAIFLKLTETWLRKYQVLEERTHPEINMSCSGGFLLTGIKVLPVAMEK